MILNKNNFLRWNGEFTTSNAVVLIFQPKMNVETNENILSNVVNVSGIFGSLPISIVNGFYSINGGAFTNQPGVVYNNQTLQIRSKSSLSFNTSSKATVTVGSTQSDFEIKTRVAKSCNLNINVSELSDPAFIDADMIVSINGNQTVYNVSGTFPNSVLEGDNVVLYVVAATSVPWPQNAYKKLAYYFDSVLKYERKSKVQNEEWSEAFIISAQNTDVYLTTDFDVLTDPIPL